MLIGVPRERKLEEGRVGLTPASVRELVRHGHEVIVEKEAGEGIGADDGEYVAAGAVLARDAAKVFRSAGMIVKVEEPLPEECAMLRPEQILFAQLNLASDAPLAEALVRSGAVCIGYETISDATGGYPILGPLSEIAGRLAVQEAGHYLTKTYGRGLLVGGLPGTTPARVVILGAGVAGSSAAQAAIATGAEVVVLDRSTEALRRVESRFGARVLTVPSTPANIEQQVLPADIVIGAAREPGLVTPKLVSGELVSRMKKGSVVVDLAIDLGGCFETSHPTTHGDPTYLVNFVVHYCVPNLPGAVPRTASEALNHVVLPYVLRVAERGWRTAMEEDPHLLDGLNVALGKVTHPAVARAIGRVFTPPADLPGGAPH